MRRVAMGWVGEGWVITQQRHLPPEIRVRGWDSLRLEATPTGVGVGRRRCTLGTGGVKWHKTHPPLL